MHILWRAHRGLGTVRVFNRLPKASCQKGGLRYMLSQKRAKVHCPGSCPPQHLSSQDLDATTARFSTFAVAEIPSTASLRLRVPCSAPLALR
jgi:hypothetical protein